MADMKHSTRRPHSKSRNGCIQCKTRKVKCDEQKPKCSGCLRRGVECTSPRDSKGAPKLQIANSPLSQSSTTEDDSHDLQFSLTDMALMQHFMHSTSKTFYEMYEPTILREARESWTVLVPQVAASHAFLMRGILALSAFHLAYLKPEEHKKWVLTGSRHYNIALLAYTAAFREVTEENCHALFAFSALILTSYFASNKFNDSEAALLLFSNPEQAEGVAEWIRLIRDSVSQLTTMMPTIVVGPMALLSSELGAGQPDRPLPTTSTNPTEKDIHHSLTQILSLPQVTTAHSPNDVAAYAQAIDKLCKVFDTRVALHQGVYTFPASVNERFIEMYGEGRPMALVVMAFYCVLLDRMREEWYIGDRAKQMLRVLRERLGDEWRRFIEWPVKEVLGEVVGDVAGAENA